MKTHLFLASSLILLSASMPALARHHKTAEPHRQVVAGAHPDTFDAWIAKQAKIHGVPEALIHRVVMRESRYHPDAMNKRFYGLMQITYQTARSMGYKGEPNGLLDAKTNLTYGVPYLANAFIVADKNSDRAIALYSKGYYFEAKHKHQLALMRTAASEPVVKEPEVAETVAVQTTPEPPANPVSLLFVALTAPAAPADQPTVQQTAAADMEPVEADVPLPPRRPNL